MGQVLHGSASTTQAIRRAIQHSQESIRALARRHGINPKTVAKWRRRTSTSDAPMGPKTPRSTFAAAAYRSTRSRPRCSMAQHSSKPLPPLHGRRARVCEADRSKRKPEKPLTSGMRTTEYDAMDRARRGGGRTDSVAHCYAAKSRASNRRR